MTDLLERTPIPPPETGGILGGQAGVITRYYADMGVSHMPAHYMPHADILNRVIERWKAERIDFYGIFHSTTIGIATARATELYEFRGKGLIRFFSLLPLLVPGTVLAIGAQIMLLKVGLGDSIAGIILIHTVASVPYCITIMTDVTAALGDKFEEQAATLGAGPFRAFFEVTLPNLMPGIMSSFSMGFIISYSQYFTTLIIGGGRINTISLVLMPYIQGGDRSLASVYAMAFTLSALGVFAMLELLIYNVNKGGKGADA